MHDERRAVYEAWLMSLKDDEFKRVYEALENVCQSEGIEIILPAEAFSSDPANLCNK